MAYFLSKYSKFINIDNERSFLLNTASGEKVRLSKCDYELLQSSISFINEENKNLIINLKNKNLIFSDEQDEEAYIRTLIKRSKETLDQRSILYGICLSYDCNLKCGYCYERSIHKNTRILTENDLDKAFEAIFKIHIENHNSKKAVIVLFGGEPFVEKNKEIIQYFFRKTEQAIKDFRKEGVECKLTIFSNGLNLLSYKKMIEIYHCIIDSFMLTLNGPKHFHDKLRPAGEGLSSHDSTVDSIDYLLSKQLSVNVRMDIDKNSLNYLDEMASFIIEKGWYANKFFRYYISPIKWIPSNRLISESEILDFFIEKSKDVNSQIHKVFSLGALRILHNVIRLLADKTEIESAKLDIYHCESVRGQQYILGSDGKIYRCLVNIGKWEKSFGTFLPQLKIKSELNIKWTQRNISEIPKCRSCSYAFICAGGCAHVAQEQTGDICTPNCIDVDKIIEKCVNAMSQGINIMSYGFYYD